MLRYCSIFLAVLLAATPALAAEGVTSGMITVGANILGGDDQDNAKFQEYRDVDDGVISGLNLFTSRDGFYLTLDAEMIGRDDQSYSAKAGRYDSYRLSAFYDKMEHNYSFDNLSVFTGVGSDTLGRSPLIVPSSTAAVNNARWRNLNNWLPLDYSVERENYGGKAEISFGTPFFLSFEVNQIDKDGVIPFATSSVVELPLPVDYKTTDFTTKLGYANKALMASVDWTVSSFNNEYEWLSYPAPGSSTGASGLAISLPPDNDMWQLGGQLVLKQLPLHSTLALRGSYSQLESDVTLEGNEGDFDGDVTYTTASASLRSRPMDRLETDLSYRYVEKDNNADTFLYEAITGSGDDAYTTVFYYKKHNAAFNLAYRLTNHNRVALGYDFTKTERAEHVRHDAEETEDHLFSVEWKNTTFDFLTAKVRYEYLNRNSVFRGAEAADAIQDPDNPGLAIDAQILRYLRPFDAANKEQDKVTVAFDVTPCDFADLGLEYNYKKADYDKTVLGRTDERSHEVMLDANLRLPGHAKLYGYAAYEKAEIDSNHRRYNSAEAIPLPPNIYPSPFGPHDEQNYNWTDERTDKSYYYGVKLELPIFVEEFVVSLAYDYQKSDGESEFNTYGIIPTQPNTGPLVDISDYDDYVKKTLNLKADYAITEALSVALGYLYETYQYDDVQWDNYRNQPGTTFYYLTGAYSDRDYKASTTYLTMSYKF